ncbi:MAG: 1-acyl-sn-glycerol-3-phosphate acyltransferase [Chlamydiae bacterium]|nr:1-acyl-sn-glycerol-3-phosphate acyltransferase [Chlamydiota bacterium]
MKHYSWLKTKQTSFLFKFVRFVVFWAFKVFYKNKIYGLSHFYQGPALIAANHTSFLDPPIVSISAPQEVHFLARKTLFKNPLFGALIRNLNSHPVSGQAEDVAVFKTIVSLLKERKKVIIFPEGKRSLNGRIGEIKPGIALLLARTEAAVIPAYIHGTYDIWNRKRSFPKFWGKTAVVFGSPIFYKLLPGKDKKEAQKEC